MPAPPADARSLVATCTAVTDCGADGVILRVEPPAPFPPLRAARFFMLRRLDELSPAIPRPFSLYRQVGEELEFLIKVMGRGTRALAATRPGEALRLIGPLGNGWPTIRPDGRATVMLGGGIGSAPFYELIRQALAGMDGEDPVPADAMTFFYGGASEGYLYDFAAFEELGVRVVACTDDGSRGFQGNVLQALRHEWEAGRVPRDARLLACGPEPMLEATAHLAAEAGNECLLSLESLMGCGVGICNGCPVATRPDGPLGEWTNAKCCVEGPVFDARAIDLAAPV